MISLEQLPECERPQGVALVALLLAVFAALAAIYGACVFAGLLPFNSGAWVVGEQAAECGWLAYFFLAILQGASALALWGQHKGGRWLAVAILGLGLLPAVPGISAAFTDMRIGGIVLWSLLIALRSAAIYLLMNAG